MRFSIRKKSVLRGARVPTVRRKVEYLEPRRLLAGDMNLEALANPLVAGQEFEFRASYDDGTRADLIDIFGPEIGTRTPILLSDPVGGIFVNGEVQIYGSHRGEHDPHKRPAIQVGNQITYFDSMLSSQGSSPWTGGVIAAAAIQPDGSVLYVGDSDGEMRVGPYSTFAMEVPTYWFSPTEPQRPIYFSSFYNTGWLRDVSKVGTVVGGENGGRFSPFFGTPEETFWTRFPGTHFSAVIEGYEHPGQFVRVISNDGQYALADSGAWIADPIQGFRWMDLSHFDLSVTSGGIEWVGVETDAYGDTYFAGQWFSLETFTEWSGIWREDGTLVKAFNDSSIAGYSAFANFTLIDGELFGGVNYYFQGDSLIVRASDGASISVQDLTGTQMELMGASLYNRAANDTLFSDANKFGMLLRDGENHYFSVFPILGGDPVEVDLHFDFDSDGIVDEIVTSKTKVRLAHTYVEAGAYTATVVAMTPEGIELGRTTTEVNVALPWTVDFALRHSGSGHFEGSLQEKAHAWPRFHEWESVDGEIWLAIDGALPEEPFDLNFQVQSTAHWLAAPVWDAALGVPGEITQSLEDGVATISVTIHELDLSEYAVGDRVLIGKLTFPPNLDNLAGVPVPSTWWHPQPTDTSEFFLIEAVQPNGGNLLVVEPRVGGEFVPVVYDTDDNGVVGLSDFVAFISHYGKTVGTSSPGVGLFDFDRNGKVGLSDFLLFIQHYGRRKDSSELNIVMPGFYPVAEVEPLTSLIEGEPAEDVLDDNLLLYPPTSQREEIPAAPISLRQMAPVSHREPQPSVVAPVDPRLIDSAFAVTDDYLGDQGAEGEEEDDWKWISAPESEER